ncbi:MAG: GNAT family N-acetyltransferase [Nitrospiraceae bacterium]|nr:GNAT family N-acetyltransferase [Nitrospiraceae bacterium]
MAEFTIDTARPEDIPALSDLLADLFSLETDFRVDRTRQIRGLRMILASPDRGTVLVARDITGTIVGMVSIQLLVSTAAGGISGQIEDLVLQRGVRSRGLGSRLLREGLAWGQSRGSLRFQLAADLRNAPALSFYTRRGFRTSSMRVLYRDPDPEKALRTEDPGEGGLTLRIPDPIPPESG